MTTRAWMAAGLAGVMPWLGCAGPRPLPPPAPPAPQAPTTSPLESHLLGTWQSQDRRAGTSTMTFERGGRVVFAGNLGFLNPGHWELNPAARELRLSFPQTPDEKLQVFALYVGQGVKSLDRPHQQVTYSFDEETHALTVAGWDYAKPPDEALPPAYSEPEPVLK